MATKECNQKSASIFFLTFTVDSFNDKNFNNNNNFMYMYTGWLPFMTENYTNSVEFVESCCTENLIGSAIAVSNTLM